MLECDRCLILYLKDLEVLLLYTHLVNLEEAGNIHPNLLV
jgi:hypothetical protein